MDDKISDFIYKLPNDLYVGLLSICLFLTIYATYSHVVLHRRVKAIEGDDYHIMWWFLFAIVAFVTVFGDLFLPKIIPEEYRYYYSSYISKPAFVLIIVFKIIDFRYKRRWKSYKKYKKLSKKFNGVER